MRMRAYPAPSQSPKHSLSPRVFLGRSAPAARLRLLGLLAEREGDFRRLNYAFDSSTEIGIQSSDGGSVRQARHRSIRISDGRSTPPRMAAVALKRLTASDQRR